MENFFSIMRTQGTGAKDPVKVTLDFAFNQLWKYELLEENKYDCRLMAMGYDKTRDFYSRDESQFTHMNTIMIDCDNKKTNGDRNILDKFGKYLNGYEFWTWESASSTPEFPRFRGIVPLDREIEWTPYNKKAIGHLFSKFVDDGASWFFEPTKGKYSTITHHEGKLFPASNVERNIKLLKDDAERRNSEFEFKRSKNLLWTMHHPEERNRKHDVSSNEKVRHYLDTSYGKLKGNGDSDSSLYRAICVCLAAGDDDTLEMVKSKALCERWSHSEIDRKIRQASKFAGSR